MIPTSPGAQPATRFSEDLDQLAREFADRPARLAELLTATQGRGYGLLLLVISLPFVTPIPLPGFSTPFGLVVFLIGARLTAGQKPWLSRRLLERELPARFVNAVLVAASKVLRVLEKVTRPRLALFHTQAIYLRLAGLMIMLSGFLLLLPLPIPFTNSLPALTVVLLAAGAMQRDGLLFLAGTLMFTLAAGYFVLLGFGGAELLEYLRELWRARA